MTNSANNAAINYMRAEDAYRSLGKHNKAEKMYISALSFYSRLGMKDDAKKAKAKAIEQKERIPSRGGLEKRVSIAGLIALLFSIPFLSLRLTGNTIANSTLSSNFAGIILLLSGITTLALTMRKN